MRIHSRIACFFSLASTFATVGTHAQLVRRNLADPDSVTWRNGQWNRASGRVSSSEDVPAEARLPAGKSLQIDVDYSGQGFEFFGVEPVMAPVPGKMRRLSAWVRALQPGYSWVVSFKDREGREKVAGKKLEWGLRPKEGQWSHVDFQIPNDWVQPVRIASINAHNWSRKDTEATATLCVYGLQVETDVSEVTDRGPLLSMSIRSDSERNLYNKEETRFGVCIDSWLGEPVDGRLTWEIVDWEGTRVAGAERALSIRDVHIEPVKVLPPRFGTYRLSATLTSADGAKRDVNTRFAVIADAPPLTESERMTSPWGLNIHGGQPGVAYNAIARIGFTWVRDYAYNLDWVRNARGGDGQYGGWPWYPTMDKKLRESGLVLLPCLMGSIGKAVADQGHLEPMPRWKRDLMQVFLDFPQYRAWELDNEYDLHHGRAESSRDWSSYAEYHRVFAEGLKYISPDTLTVEQGTAGVHPGRVRQFVKSGAFADIDVVNGHFYCGTTPPELALRNRNVGVVDGPPQLVFDVLREFAESADADGKDRQAWITEFGWDTLAVHIVSELEQAAYLQRGYLLGLQAGLDRMFWYWNRDSKDAPDNFFDGCGIFDPRDEPKPAVAAMAAMTRFLRQPEPLGTFALGENTMGHVFRDGDHLVACAFALAPDGRRPRAELPNGNLSDMFGNPIASRTVSLGPAPVWIADISEDDPLVRQAAFDLTSPYLVRATAGDPVTVNVRIRNRRNTSLRCALRIESPETWTVDKAVREETVRPGETAVVPFHVRIDPAERALSRDVTVVVTEGDVRKALRTQVLTVQAATLTVEPLPATPGTHTVSAVVTNNSLAPRSFVLDTAVPAGWSVTPKRVELIDVPAGGKRKHEFTVTWSLEPRLSVPPLISVLTPEGAVIADVPFTPGAIRIPRMDTIKADADLSDWPDAARVPPWLPAGLGPAPDADIYVAYSDAGLHIACDVRNSAVKTTAPRQFWTGDCVELFVDTANDKKARRAYNKTDHQFWFVPLVDEGRVYVGRWKRNDEIPATLYDIPDVPSACRRTDKGYTMEALVPTSLLYGFAPVKGNRLGLNINISVPGKTGDMEVYWRRAKPDNVPTTPHEWGTVVLE